MAAPTDPQLLSVGVCLYNGVTVLDFQYVCSGPVDILGALVKEGFVEAMKTFPRPPKYNVTIEFLSKTLDPVKPYGPSPALVPTMTYDDALGPNGKQFDIILVPAGPPGPPPMEAVGFLARQGPGAKYILTVCAGSAILAATGLIDGRKATGNKFMFKLIQSMFPKVDWVPKARWVVDGNIWTSSGVTAGFDMAHAFLGHLVGDEIASIAVNSMEYRAQKDPRDDEFAVIHGLVDA